MLISKLWQSVRKTTIRHLKNSVCCLFALGQGEKVTENKKKRVTQSRSQIRVSEEELDCRGKAAGEGHESFARIS